MGYLKCQEQSLLFILGLKYSDINEIEYKQIINNL